MPRILMAQINPLVGDIDANSKKILEIIQTHQETHDLIIFPELAIIGYPPEDLLFRKTCQEAVKAALNLIQASTTACTVVVGHPSYHSQKRYNSASVFHNREIIHIYHKQCIPNYGVFDEARYFEAALPTSPSIITVKNLKFGLCICEDIWHAGPVEQLIAAKAEAIVCLNASPFEYKKPALREERLAYYAKQGVAVFYVNQIGGQDELVFDGQSLVYNAKGQLSARAPAFKESLETIEMESSQRITGLISPLLEETGLIYKALVCGLRDYVEKNHFKGVVLGLSGGIDSALTLTLAVDALGAKRVHALKMPSEFTAEMSIADADKQLAALHVSSTTLSIDSAFQCLLSTLAPCFKNHPFDTAEENIQARIRGLLLMAYSNKTGYMVVTTSNKSETAVGYTTLYGDMVGGFAPLKDVLKTQVYALARYRNQLAPVIPERVLLRPPSAELAYDQCDQDTLPPYEQLDKIIQAYIEENLSLTEIIALGYPEAETSSILAMIRRNEYKRRQAPLGVKISSRAFGRDWRVPITGRWC